MTTNPLLPPIVAANGRALAVRFLTPDDGDLLIAFFLRLSPETRYSRFHATLENLTPAMLQHEAEPLLDVDGIHRLALVAVDQEEGQEVLVGVVRLARGPDEQEAEVAVVVRDDWQRQGIGSGLMLRLASVARSLGVTSFWAVVMSSNRAALNIFSNLNVPIHTHFEHGEAHVRIALEDMPL